MKLVEEYKFPSLFINQFFPRPGTPAAKMPKIPAQQVEYKSKLHYLQGVHFLPLIFSGPAL